MVAVTYTEHCLVGGLFHPYNVCNQPALAGLMLGSEHKPYTRGGSMCTGIDAVVAVTYTEHCLVGGLFHPYNVCNQPALAGLMLGAEPKP